MAISEAKRKMREQIRAQQKKSSENRGKTLNSTTSYFEITENSGISQWIPKVGEDHAFDIVLFKAGPNFPDLYHNLKEGDWAYLLDIGVHKNVGPEKAWVLCPKSFKSHIAKGDKKGCPICERLAKKQAALNKDDAYYLWQKMKAQRRVMYFVISRDGGKEEEKGVQVLECFRGFMEEVLQDLAKAKRGREEITYADTDDGKTISFMCTKKSSEKKDRKGNVIGTIEWPEFEAHEFLDRKDENGKPYVIDEEICESNPPLDSFLVLKSYEELLEMLGPEDFEGEDHYSDNDYSDEPPAASSRMDKVKDEYEDKDAGYNDDACPHGFELGKDCNSKPECEDCEGDIYTTCSKLDREMKRAKRNKK